MLKAEDTDPSLSPITNSKFSGQNIHTSFNSEQFSNYIQVDYETDIDVDDHIDFISCNSNCSYTNANTIPHYNDSSAMNSKLSYQAINRKSHKTLNTLFGIPVTITHNYSYTYSNIAFLDGGSMKSLIKISLFSKLCSTFSSNDIPVLRKTNIVLKSISGDKLLVHGKTTLILIINNTPFICDFIVVEDSCCTYPKDILIGCDILTKIPLLLDYSAQTAYLKDKGDLKPLPLLPMTNSHFKSSENISQIQKTLSQKQKQKLNKPDYISIDIDPISESKSQTTESSDYFSNAKLQSLQNELHELKTHLEDFPSQSSNSSSENMSQNINNSSFHENFYNTNPIYYPKNLVLDDTVKYKVFTKEKTTLLPHSKYILNVKVESDLQTYAPENLTLVTQNRNDLRSNGQIFIGSTLSNCTNGNILLECINIGTDSVNLDTHSFLTTASPIEITENHTNFNDFSSINATTTYSSDLSDEEIRKVFKEILLSNSAKTENTYVLQKPEQLTEMLDFLVKNRDIISFENDPVGRCDLLTFKIKLKEGSPDYVYTAPYRHPHKYLQAIDDWVDDNLKKGYIVPSNSPSSSPVLVIPKKNSTKYRTVIDYRKLNSLTIPDRFPLPNISESLSLIGNAKIFSTLDLLSGFTHIVVDKESRGLLAFSTARGHFEPVRMPQGTTNSPSVFSRAMEMALSGLLGVYCLLFIDDCLIFSKNIDEHYNSLSKVFKALRKANLRIKLEKCEFFKTSVTYLGFKVSDKGLSPDPNKLQALKGFKIPTNVSEVRSLLGFFNYFRHLIPNYSHTAHPLTQLLRKNISFQWNLEQQIAYDNLKKQLLLDPALSFPDYSKPFILSVDASDFGLGGVLAQLDSNGLEKPLAFTSRLLTKAEKNYSTTEREALAVIHALSKFRTIILGYKIYIVVDHSPLIHLFRHRQLTGRLERWNLKIQSFNPEFIYKKGKLNVVPDYLSRNPAPDVSQSILSVTSLNTSIFDLTKENFYKEQRSCPRLSPLINWFEKLPSSRLGLPHTIINGLLYYVTADNRYLLEVPNSMIYSIIFISHNALGSGHPGSFRTIKRVRELYTFPNLSKLCEIFCKECNSCLEVKGNKPHPIGISTYPLPFQPFSRIHLDTLGPFPKCKSTNSRYILVFKDSLTRYTEICPVPSRDGKEVAKALLERVITRHSTPNILITDNAAEFKSEFFTELCKLWRIRNANISIYHPISNSIVERENKNIENYLRHYVNSNHDDWGKFLPFCQIALNSSYNISIGNTPHFLLHYYIKRLPYNLPNYTSPFVETKSQNTNKEFLHDYTAEMFERASAIRELSRDKLQTETAKIANRQHQNAPIRKANVGDRVYIISVKPPHQSPKLASRWKGPYLVVNVLKFGKYLLQCLETNKQFVLHIDNFKIVPYPKLGSKENNLKSCLKSYSSPNVEHSNKRVQFQLNEKESNTKINTNLNTSNLFPRKDNQISLGDSNQCLKQHFRTSSQAFSRKENTTKQNSKFQSSQNSYHPQILPDSYSYPKTFHNRSLQPQTLQNSSHSQTYSYPKTFQNSSPQPQTLQNSSHSQTYSCPKTSVNSHPYSSQTFSHFQNSPHSPTSVNPLSHSSQTIPHSQTSPNFHSHSPQTSSPHILQNITPHNSPLRHNNSPSNSSPSPMMKDNRQTDPSYKPHPLYKNSQNISQMRLRSHTKQTQNVQNISIRKLRSHFK